jgi:flagellar motor protein MotB
MDSDGDLVPLQDSEDDWIYEDYTQKEIDKFVQCSKEGCSVCCGKLEQLEWLTTEEENAVKQHQAEKEIKQQEEKVAKQQQEEKEIKLQQQKTKVKQQKAQRKTKKQQQEEKEVKLQQAEEEIKQLQLKLQQAETEVKQLQEEKEVKQQPTHDQVESNHPPEALPLSYGHQEKAKTTSKGKIISVFTFFILVIAIVSQFFGANTGSANSIGLPTNNNVHEIILDTGCSTSCSGLGKWLSNRIPVFFQMRTANNGISSASCKATAVISGLPLRVLHIPEFQRTLVSWTDLAEMGFTAQMLRNTIEIFDVHDKLWTTVNLGIDRLWHFTDAERETSLL